MDAKFLKGDNTRKRTAAEIFREMKADGGWFSFEENDNIQAIIELRRKGKIEFDPLFNNRVESVIPSIRARAVE